jgi:hypothetical protein
MDAATVAPMTDEAISAVWLDGVKLDIYPGDVSDFEEKVRALIQAGGGWLYYPQPHVIFQLHVSASSSVIIRYPK